MRFLPVIIISASLLTGLTAVAQTTTQGSVPGSVPTAKKRKAKDIIKDAIQNGPVEVSGGPKLSAGASASGGISSSAGSKDGSVASPNLNISSVDDARKFATETLPDLGLKISKSFKKVKKELKSLKREFNGRDYEGLKVEKQVLRQGSGSRLTYHEFYTLREYKQPDPYSRRLYWFDHKANRIVEGIGRDKERNDLMHGPYKRYVGDVLIEDGWYYMGTKHGRWELYDKNNNLLNKEYYEKGFARDATISYYDESQRKIKEVLPRNYNKVTGEYFLFNESGTLAEQGMMDDSVKVGQWVEYYPTGNRRKKEIQYGKDCFDTSFESFVIREYDERGKMIFESPKVKKN
jgi:antitoxin component YwqK of YwqJK toxin-antitoxin module